MRDGQVVIVHVSDLHRSTRAAVSDAELTAHFRDDVHNGYARDNEHLERSGLRAPHLPAPEDVDLLIVSGDLTASGAEEEFNRTEQVLEKLRGNFPTVDRERVIIVPGNHDISWSESQAAYALEEDPSPAKQADAFREESELRLDLEACPPRLRRRIANNHYENRLAEYERFHDRYYEGKRSFPRNDRARHFGIFDDFAESLGIVVVGFSSCDTNDHLWRRGRIHPEAILCAAAELDRRGWTRRKAMRIAVWHHNVHGGPYQLDFLDSSATHLLAEVGFSIGFHGHLHELIAHTPAMHRRDLLVVGAGSMSARANERPDSVPLQYNVIGINPRTGQGWIHIRSRTPAGAWGLDANHGANRDAAWLPLQAMGPREVTFFQSVQHSDFTAEIERRLRTSKRVCFVGTGLSALTERIREVIVSRARENQLEARICFGNPYAPDVRARLIEEERGDLKPVLAAEGILRRARALVEHARGLPNVQVSFFNNYPTLSIFRFDHIYYSYPMGYRRLGNTCPALRVEAGHVHAQFLDEQIEKYLADAVDANELLHRRERTAAEFRHPDRIKQLAVFLVPAESSSLARDVRALFEASDPPDDVRVFRRSSAELLEYGLHVTVVDVMYVEDSQIPTIESEVRDVARRAAPFPLMLDKVNTDFGLRRNIVIECSDQSGNLERLHFEMAHRLLPVSLGTNYTLNPTVMSKLQGLTSRDQLFLREYSTPYLFQGYRPHFTLASASTAKDRASIRTTVERRLRGALMAQQVRIDAVWIFHRKLPRGNASPADITGDPGSLGGPDSWTRIKIPLGRDG
jgi:predicted phosphodiesterase